MGPGRKRSALGSTALVAPPERAPAAVGPSADWAGAASSWRPLAQQAAIDRNGPLIQEPAVTRRDPGEPWSESAPWRSPTPAGIGLVGSGKAEATKGLSGPGMGDGRRQRVEEPGGHGAMRSPSKSRQQIVIVERSRDGLGVGAAEGGTWGHGIHGIGFREPGGTWSGASGDPLGDLETADRNKIVGAGACGQRTPGT